MTLHDELQRIADRAPVADVPQDTWRRARRARTRDRGLVLGTVVAAVTLVAATIAWLPRHVDPPIADSGPDAALPTVLHAVPERLSQYDEGDHRWPDDIVSDDLAVGTAVAAWVSWDTLPVVVGATDGRYHLLDLPGFTGKSLIISTGSFPPALALSPDGRTLAFSYADFGPEAATEPIPSGVRLLDLVSGDVEDVPLPGEEGTAVSALAWSVDGDTVGWAGVRLGSWTEHSYGQASPAAGTIDPETRAVDEVDDKRIARHVSNWGSSTLRVADDGTLRAHQLADPDQPHDIAVLPGGRRLVLAPDPTGDDSLRSIELAGPDVTGVMNRGVAVVEDGAMRSLTIAVALLDPDHPSVDRPAPDWPLSDERLSIYIGLGVAAAIGVLLGLRRLGRWLLQRRSAR